MLKPEIQDRYLRNYETERRENLTQGWEREMQFPDAT